MKQEDVIKKFSGHGNTPFIYETDGGAYSIEGKSGDIDQIGTMLFQTLETLDIDDVGLLEVIGDKRSVVMKISSGRIIGTILDEKVKTDDVLKLLAEIERSLGAEVEAKEEVEVEEKAKEEVEVEEGVVDLKGLSEKINLVLTEFLGDFAARVYRNQLKILSIEEKEIPMKKVKELVYALGDAASLMIGPTQSQEMTDRLLLLIK